MKVNRKWVSLLLGLALLFSISFVAFTAQNFDEAPMLKEKVEAGELPSVAERLPDNPLVIEPLKEIGEYGGTWNRFGTSEGWHFVRMSMYGFSFVRLINDGLDVAPNLIVDWEANEDKTSWTLHLREGIKWSDGAALTVDDILFWWEDMALNDDHSEYVPEWAIADGEPMEMTKIDDYTVRFDYAAPEPLLIRRLAIWIHGGLPNYSAVAPKHYLKQFHPEYNDEYEDYEAFEQKQEWWHNMECPVLSAWMPVEEKAGKRLVLERNPYYYAVDTEGNQLPYIDRVNVRFVSDDEVLKLKLMNGESDMQIRPNRLTLRDVAMLKKNESKFNFETLMWDSGTGAGPVFVPNRNHPDPEKQELYKNTKFLRALSHAINRQRINKMVFYGTANPTTGNIGAKNKLLPYTRTERGAEIYERMRNLAIEYDPAKSKEMLDEIGVVDQDGDGWRDMPSGKELKLRIDMGSGQGVSYVDVSEMTKGFWRDIGLKTIVNPTDPSKLGVMNQEATFDIRTRPGGVPDNPTMLTLPVWLLPTGIGSGRWAPLYATWFSIKGTREEGTELDKAPRDRTPAREKPPEGSPSAKLQELYLKAKTALTWQERDKLILDMLEIHIENGPFFIGTVANYPAVGVVKDSMKNVPRKEDLATGGTVTPWCVPYIAIISPEQFYIDK